MTHPYYFAATIKIEGKMMGTPEQIKQYVDIKVRNLIHDMNIPEPSDEIKMHVEPGTSTVFRKITSDGYVM
jgi:hypothetical protein